jgi:hypothetical protein
MIAFCFNEEKKNFKAKGTTSRVVAVAVEFTNNLYNCHPDFSYMDKTTGHLSLNPKYPLSYIWEA